MRKRIWSLLLTAALLFGSVPALAADSETVTVRVNGEVIEFAVEPVMENDRVWVSMAELFRALGVEAETADGSIMVPLRAIAEGLGAEVDWTSETQTVEIRLHAKSAGGNFTDEMKMPITYDYNDYGANAVDRQGDHKGSPYFSNVDFYHAESNDTLTILPRFKTIQQTSWWSCGVSSVEMVLNYYGKLGDWNEKTLADLRTDHSDIHIGTCLDQIIEMFDKVGGFQLETTYDYKDNLDAINMAFIKTKIKEGLPIIVGWNDWGGHWQIIIGYDDMGTAYEGDDVIIVADSFDTTDHNQDGYGVYGAERFIYNFTARCKMKLK